MRRIAFILFAALIMPTLALAGTSAARVAQYEHTMQTVHENVSLAYVVSICGIRSDHWFDVLQTGAVQFGTMTANLLHITAEDRVSIEKDFKVLPAQLLSRYFPNHCRDLLNSQDVDNLDEIENRLTGGYH